MFIVLTFKFSVNFQIQRKLKRFSRKRCPAAYVYQTLEFILILLHVIKLTIFTSQFDDLKINYCVY